jgi:hypothetical protein
VCNFFVRILEENQQSFFVFFFPKSDASELTFFFPLRGMLKNEQQEGALLLISSHYTKRPV